MPSKSLPRYCWDANVLLAFINGELGRVQHIKGFLEEADKKRVEVLTSMLSVVEVAYVAEEKAQGHLDITLRNKIEALWQPNSAINRVEFHFGIAQDARELIRSAMTRGWGLKPADAIHLATAARMDVTAFHTYEKEGTRKRWSDLLGIPVEEPIHSSPPML